MHARSWLVFGWHGDDTFLAEDEQAYPFSSLSQTQKPALVALVGHTAKTAAIDRLVRRPTPSLPGTSAGHVSLQLEPDTRHDNDPVIYLDCGLHDMPTQSTPTIRTFEWKRSRNLVWTQGLARDDIRGRHKLAVSLYSRVLTPLVGCFCVFADDFNGLRGTTTFLHNLAYRKPVYECTPAPRILVVFSDVGPRFKADSKKRQLLDALRTLGIQRFSDLQVVGLPIHRKDIQGKERWRHDELQASIRRLVTDDQAQRAHSSLHFSPTHLREFLKIALDKFAGAEQGSIELLQVARSTFKSQAGLEVHILNALIAFGWCGSNVLARFIASALVLDCLPPGMHAFDVSLVFGGLYQWACKKAFDSHFDQQPESLHLMQAVRAEFRECYTRVATGTISAADARRSSLRAAQQALRKAYTTQTCLCCVRREPEKTLQCTHAMCNTCVRIFGVRSQDHNSTWIIEECLLCGVENHRPQLRLKPPTAGARILSIDGGGARGVIPLVFLAKIQEILNPLQCPLRECFDFVGGTSAGGLIALGIFLMKWSPDKSLEKFKMLAAEVFRRRNRNNALFFRVQDFVTSYLNDCRYDSGPVEETFEAAFEDVRMFNPAADDVKVAITTTTAKVGAACLFTNYLHGALEKSVSEKGYVLARCRKEVDGILIRDVARCTTAAPWYFRPKILDSVEEPEDNIFQDGGLTYNNPLPLCVKELARLWPDQPRPDFALSLGTGKPERIRGGYSQRVRKCIPRLLRMFLSSLDGEKAWEDVRNSLDEASQPRYHRVNLELPESKLGLDDVGLISELEEKATRYFNVNVAGECDLRKTLDLLYPSFFYLELDGVPSLTDGHLCCEGTIHCRLYLSSQGMSELYKVLQEKNAHFIVNGKAIRCIEKSSNALVPTLFRRRVSFILSTYTDMVSISLENITNHARSISGLPCSLHQLLECQELLKPFGCANHFPPCATNPPVHSGVKRKRRSSTS